jgi:hypothetical protein
MGAYYKFFFGAMVTRAYLNDRCIRMLESFNESKLRLLADVLLDDIMPIQDAIEWIEDLSAPTVCYCPPVQFRRSDSPITIPHGIAQSDTVEHIDQKDTSNEQEENVGFADAEIETDLVIGNMSSDPTFYQGSQENASLGSFLSRPVNIYNITWDVGAVSPFFDVINPWELFLSDARVLNKLDTFKLLNGTLKIKVLVNGSPYHFGRVFVGCRPTRYDNNMSTSDPTTPALSAVYFDNPSVAFKTYRSGTCMYSQRPHVFVDPATNQPNHIDWPFFAATNFLDLNDPECIDRLGRLEIWEINTLQHNNGATDPLTIAFYAWMEDVNLTGLTAQPVAVSQSASRTIKDGKKSGGKKMNNQSGKDEYQGNGMISGPATAVANYAAYFTEIPYIGKFARATKIASGGLSDIARIFGYSRPPQIENTTIMRPQTFGNFSNTSGGDPLIKLSLDPKQELTIDPATVGLMADDQMAIGYIAKKEALIDSFTWSSNVGADILLYSILVHPMVAPVDSDVGTNRYWQTPLSFASFPFTYWTGSLRYRFQVVASAFHRGRLAVVY